MLIDDNAAKKTAKFLGLTVTGTLGVILKAKKEKMIPDVTTLLNQLIKTGFYITPYVYSLVQNEAGE